jgi:hypothetical protein
MSESEQQIEDRPNMGGDPGGDGEVETHQPRWLVGLLIATSILIIIALGAYLFYGRELFQRPFLVVAVGIAWLGALVGVSVASEPG